MSKERRDDGRQQIKVGNIHNSSGIVIGNGSSATFNQPRESMQDEVSTLLGDFIRSLAYYNDSLDDAEGVRQTAAAVRAEVDRPSPKWQVVRHTLTTIAAGVAGVAALTDAINNIQALVAHIID